MISQHEHSLMEKAYWLTSGSASTKWDDQDPPEPSYMKPSVLPWQTLYNGFVLLNPYQLISINIFSTKKYTNHDVSSPLWLHSVTRFAQVSLVFNETIKLWYSIHVLLKYNPGNPLPTKYKFAVSPQESITKLNSLYFLLEQC